MLTWRSIGMAIALMGCAVPPPGGLHTQAIPGLAFGQSLPGIPGLGGLYGLGVGQMNRTSLAGGYWNTGLLSLIASPWPAQNSLAAARSGWLGGGAVGGLGVDPGVGRLFPSTWLTPNATPPTPAQPAQPQPAAANPGTLRAGEGLLRFLRPVNGPLVPPV